MQKLSTMKKTVLLPGNVLLRTNAQESVVIADYIPTPSDAGPTTASNAAPLDAASTTISSATPSDAATTTASSATSSNAATTAVSSATSSNAATTTVSSVTSSTATTTTSSSTKPSVAATTTVSSATTSAAATTTVSTLKPSAADTTTVSSTKPSGARKTTASTSTTRSASGARKHLADARAKAKGLKEHANKGAKTLTKNREELLKKAKEYPASNLRKQLSDAARSEAIATKHNVDKGFKAFMDQGHGVLNRQRKFADLWQVLSDLFENKEQEELPEQQDYPYDMEQYSPSTSSPIPLP